MSDTSSNQDSLEQRLVTMEKRLKDLEDELVRAKADANQALPHTDGPTFSQDGSIHPEMTDDAIAPG